MLKAIFWNVDHGSAAFIKTATANIVIDLGAGTYRDSDFSPLLHLKNKYNVNILHSVIITHPHADHMDDIFNLSKFTINTFFRPSHLKPDEIYKGNPADAKDIIDYYLTIDRLFTNKYIINKRPFQIPLGNEGKIQIFSPKDSARTNLNNHSLIIVLFYLGYTILIPGDNENSSWNELLSRDDFIDAIIDTDILVASHHGRKSGVCYDLFVIIEPRLTIVSDESYVQTSASSFYSGKSSGYRVYYRNGEYEERKCIATRTNGAIKVEIGKIVNSYKNVMRVTAD